MRRTSTVFNLLSLSLLQLFSFIIPLLTLPYLARTLGLNSFGEYSFIQAVIIIGGSVTDYGYIINGTRRIASLRGDDGASISKILNAALYSKAILSLLVIMLCTAVLFFFGGNAFRLNILLYVWLSIFCSSFNLIWLFQGLEKVVKYSFYNLFMRVLVMFLTFYFVRGAGSLTAAVLMIFFPILMNAIYGVTFIKKNYNWKPEWLGREVIRNEFKEGFFYFLPTLYSILFTNLGIVVLGFTQSSAIVGGYSALERLVKAGASMSGPVNQVVYPKAAQAHTVSYQSFVKILKRYATISLPIFAAFSLFTALFGRYIIYSLFGPEYVRFIDVLPLLSIFILLANLNTFIGVIYLTVSGNAKAYSHIFLASFIVAAIIYILLSRRLSYHASAVGLVAGEALMSFLIGIFVLSKRNKNHV